MKMIDHHQVKKLFCISREQRIEEHRSLLKTISRQAAAADTLYGKDLPIITDPEDMSGLPVVNAERITKVLADHPLESVLNARHDHCFKTSGYSGVSKTFYYTNEDADMFADIWAAYVWLTGVRSGSSFWNFGSKRPMISAELLQWVRSRFVTSRDLYTPIKTGMDLVSALKKASKSPGADVIAGPTLVYYLICRAVRDPDYMYDSMVRVLQNDHRLPAFLSRFAAKALLSGFQTDGLSRALEQMHIGYSYAEPLSSYREMIQEYFPNIKMYDVYGSTEVPIIGATLNRDDDVLALLMPALFAELADPLEVYKAKQDPSYGVKTIPWYRWEAGMTGELIISRPGRALPLFRYATGDLLEVIDPMRSFIPETASLYPEELTDGVPAPAIKVIARAADVMDFETDQEMGSFLGKKIYTPQIQQAIGNIPNVVWWELFRIRKGDSGPGPLIFLIYPEVMPEDAEVFVETIREVLMYKTPDETDTIKSADSMGLLEIRITHPSAFDVIQSEIIEKIEAASSLGQLKPRHIFTVETRLEFSRKVGRKLIEALR